MKGFLKAVFMIGGFVGLLVMMCAFSTVDHPGSIPISDGQIVITALIGLGMIIVAVQGWKSLDKKGH